MIPVSWVEDCLHTVSGRRLSTWSSLSRWGHKAAPEGGGRWVLSHLFLSFSPLPSQATLILARIRSATSFSILSRENTFEQNSIC